MDEERKIKVYIKVNSENEVTEINSEIFIKDLTGWTFIDEGYGDKFAHAQSNYFDKPIYTENGDYAYEYINGHIQEKDNTANEQLREKQARIAELKFYLSETDYRAIKYAEGVITAEEYAATKAQRQAWRDEINALEN